ncbi:MAG: replicative DNA helicase, partial [Prevotella sp.]|nr:replicative DNA helicase [Prevotella sp.]
MPNNSNSNNNQRRAASAKTPTFDPGLGHLPPQSVETERLVLGALMVDKDAFTVVSEILRPETFYEPRNQKVFAAIQTLSINENPVDIITVTEQLKRDGTLEEVGGQMYVYDLTAHVASSAHVEYHSRILAQKYLARQLITFASQIETLAFDEGNDIELVMQEAEGKLFELSQKNMRQDYTQIDPVVKSALDIMQRAASNAGGLTGVSSGYTKLDDMTSGWQKSDLVILAGRPAMGKTSFALSIAKNVAVDNRVPTAFFSLEMSNIQLVNRLISNTCEIDSKKVMNGQLDDAEWRRLDTNIRKLEGAPLYLDDTPGLSIFELRTKARRLVREKKVEIIMIDYLQLMNANGMRFGNRQEEVSTISRSLKSLAKELDIPIIALSQLNRSVEQRDNEG